MLAQYYFVMSNNTYLVIRRGSEVHFHMVFGCFVTKCWDLRAMHAIDAH